MTASFETVSDGETTRSITHLAGHHHRVHKGRHHGRGAPLGRGAVLVQQAHPHALLLLVGRPKVVRLLLRHKQRKGVLLAHQVVGALENGGHELDHGLGLARAALAEHHQAVVAVLEPHGLPLGPAANLEEQRALALGEQNRLVATCIRQSVRLAIVLATASRLELLEHLQQEKSNKTAAPFSPDFDGAFLSDTCVDQRRNRDLTPPRVRRDCSDRTKLTGKKRARDDNRTRQQKRTMWRRGAIAVTNAAREESRVIEGDAKKERPSRSSALRHRTRSDAHSCM